MAALEITVFIDDQEYSQRQLEDIQRERGIHVLHEMKRLGAVIKDGGNILSHDDIDYLSAADVKRISVATRASFDRDGIKNLFREQIQRSKQMWQNIVNDSTEEEPMKLATATLHVIGFGLENLQNLMGSMGKDNLDFLMNPEHFALSVTANGMHQLETIGMYGEPTEMWVYMDPNTETPIARDPEYPIAMVGYSKIGNDETSIRNTMMMHQFKPTENGMLLKTCMFFPPKTPQDLVDGHKIHLAIEFSEGIRAASAK